MTNKTSEETTYYRNFLNDLIVNIRNEIPNTPENELVILDLNSTLESLWYKAPEVLTETFISILNILTMYIPLHTDDSLNPQWVKNINKIWLAAVQESNNGFEIGATTENISAPPLNDDQKIGEDIGA